MIDELVWELNQLGYQAAWLPQTGLVPPDVYNVADVAGRRRLVRRGPLQDYVSAVAQLKIDRGRTTDLDHHRTTRKQHKGAVDFLKRALGYLGVSSIPKLELGFTGGSEFTISFSDVHFARVDISAIEPVLVRMQTHAIPEEVITSGRLHIAYEYLYAGGVHVTRADQKAFDADVEGRVGEFIDVGTDAQVRVEQGTRLAFSGKGERAAFAYKAARLTRSGAHWELATVVSLRSSEGAQSSAPYLPASIGVVLDAGGVDG